MAAPMHDFQHSPSNWAPPVARFFALVPLLDPGDRVDPGASSGRTGPTIAVVPQHTPSEPLDGPPRPSLRVIPGGAEAALRRRRAPEVYRRRRLMAGVVAAAVVLTLVGVIVPLVHDSATAGAPVPPAAAPTPVTGTAATSAMSVASADDAMYLVRPGDTLWSIAASMDPPGDIRAVVDELSRRAGPGPLVAGTRLDVSGLAGS